MSCCMSWMGCRCSGPSGTKTTITNYKQRSCTDVFFLFLSVCVITVIVITCWLPALEKEGGITNIDAIKRITLVHDFQHNRCGHGKFADKPVAYWPYIKFTGNDTSIRKHKTLKLCAENCHVTQNTTRMVTHTYESKNYGGYGYCIPKISDSVVRVTDRSGINKEKLKKFQNAMSGFVEDIAAAKWIILASVGITLVVSLVYIFLMKIFIAPLVYCSIVCIISALGAISFALFQYSDDLPNVQSIKWMSYIIAGVAVLFLIALCCLGSSIKMGVEITKSSSRAFKDVKSVLFFPFLTFISEILFFIFWFYIAMYLFAASEMKQKNFPEPQRWTNGVFPGYENDFPPVGYTKLDYNKTAKTVFLPHLFILVWVTAIINYFTYTVICGVIADWYFTPRDGKSGKKLRWNKFSDGYNNEIHLTTTPIYDAICRTVRYHIGTVVFAASVISIIRFIRYCLLSAVKIMDGGQRPNKIQKCLTGCVCCLIKLLECIFDKVNKNALIFCSIYGHPFIASVGGSFSLIWSNPIRAAFISMISTIVTSLGTIMITLLTLCLSAFILIKGDETTKRNSPVFPLLIIACISYQVSKLFLSVYDTAIDTIFICFLIDEKHNKNNGCMLADKGLKGIVSKYEHDAKQTASNNARFRQ